MAARRFIAIYTTDSLQNLIELAQTLAPRLEVWSPHAVLLEVPARYEQETLDRLRQQAGAGWQLGVASTRMAAFLAAQAAPDEQGDRLPLPDGRGWDRFASLLRRWGIQTRRELASLPEAELVARLGPGALSLQKIARGEDLTPFQAYLPELRFEVSREMDWSLDSLQPLTFILAGLLDPLCRELESYGRATDAVHLILKLEDRGLHERTLQLAFPTRNPRLLLSLLRLELESHPPRAGVVGVMLRAQPARPRVFQYSFLQPLTPDPEKLSLTLSRLTALLGKEHVGFPVCLDTHRPDAFRIEEQKSKRAKEQTRGSRKPEAVSLSLQRVRPPTPLGSRLHQVRVRAGPWRSSGDWWSQGWGREEWDVELADGTLCRIYWDQHRKEWFLEGVYD